MKTTSFNWAGLLVIGSSFFAFLMLLESTYAASADNYAGLYALISLALAVLCIPAVLPVKAGGDEH